LNFNAVYHLVLALYHVPDINPVFQYGVYNALIPMDMSGRFFFGRYADGAEIPARRQYTAVI
jgi:hypothetical protein